MQQMEVFDKNAEKYQKAVKVMKRKVESFLKAYVSGLETKDGKVLNNENNLKKALLVQTEVLDMLRKVGYDDFAENFVADTSGLIKEI